MFRRDRSDVLTVLEPRLGRVALSIVLGALALGSGLALIAVSAWLITRAWQMPPVLALTVAVVTVRALAIARGVFGYCERLASHGTALRAAADVRERIYSGLACGDLDSVMRRPSARLVTVVGSDVDRVADALVRGVIPFGVAGVLACAGIGLVGAISPSAAIVMATAMLIAGVVVPLLVSRSVRAEEAAALAHHAARDQAAVAALAHADELRVGGRLDDVIAECRSQQSRWGRAADRAAAPVAVASATPIAATAVSLLAAVVAGIELSRTVAPTTVAVLMLVPLAAFEAIAALPHAATALARARLAAARLDELTGPVPPEPIGVVPDVGQSGELAAVELRSGFAATAVTEAITVTLPRGSRALVVGPSGAGKTALLMTLAGLLSPRDGTVTLDGTSLKVLDERFLVGQVAFFAEDAHVFSTTVRDNLLVVRGDCTDGEVIDALDRVGLRPWRNALPDGLDTVLAGGAQAVSAGQRRRLLLARALLSQAPIVLLDEPTEHLDADDAEPILDALLNPSGGLFAADRTVVVATHQVTHEPSSVSLMVLSDAEFRGRPAG